MLNWDKLRSDPDVRRCFEELCRQLARCESSHKDSKFIPKAPPDAGVECFSIFADGSEWGWQAKYFRESPSPSQWGQIDKSVKRALSAHPNLKKYFICLPVDRSDARIRNQKSFLDKWDEHVQCWKQIKDIEFMYWGTSEIEDMLSRGDPGKINYFFDIEFLSRDWFNKRLQEAITNADMRYSPQLNVDLPIAKNFEALGRTVEFHNRLKQQSRRILEEFDYSKSSNAILKARAEFNELNCLIDFITNILKTTDTIGQEPISFEDVYQNSKKALETISKIVSKLEKITRTQEQRDTYERPEINDFGIEKHHLWKLYTELSELQKLSKSDSYLVANTGALLLRGDAGNGKTHLFCDVATHRRQSGLFSVLLHGRHFSDDATPGYHILTELDLHCSFDEFLGALDAAGQANNSVVLIMIDALNEGAGLRMWSRRLPALLKQISEYKWVRIAVSVRTSYEKAIVPESIRSDQLSKFTHRGFAMATEDAIKTFFDKNGIERPRVPLLIPEFSNPQFLFILCKGLKSRRLTSIPNDLKGLTSVYRFFIDSVNDTLAHETKLDYPPHENKVQKAIDLLARHMASMNTRFLRYQDADSYLQEIHHSSTQSKSLLYHLITEGILSMDLRKESDTIEPYVQFMYERLGDNLIVQNQLKDVTTEWDAAKLFRKNGAFAKYFDGSFALTKYAGLVDAISIQLPEKINRELIEVNPELAKDNSVLESFLDSIMWRHPESIKESTLAQIKKHIIRKRSSLDRFFKVILTVSTDFATPLNSEYLHKYLSDLEMADRDSIWSTFIHYEYYEEGSIVRQWIDWIPNTSKLHLTPEWFYLAGLALSWFLTSSNRTVRDRATKALVSLLSGRAETLLKILEKFAKCNDPYVVERLFCVACGFAMRNNDKSGLKRLADFTYLTVFKNTNPPPNILLRDYAKCIIDCALHKRIKLDVDHTKLNPPYCSNWIPHFPTEEDIEKLKAEYSREPPYDITDGGALQIFGSLGSWGDFYRYIIGGNSNSFEWAAVRLLSNNKSRETVFEEFDKSITRAQKIPWQNYCVLISDKKQFENVKKQDREEVFGFVFEDNEFDSVVEEYKHSLRKKLNAEQQRIFDKYVEPYMELSSDWRQSKNCHDLKSLARWIIKRVFELGWTKDRFGLFDRNMSMGRSYTTTAKPERMGKKYQWIAYSELLARTSDTFEFHADMERRAFARYQYPSQLVMGGRDIDPSLLISSTSQPEYGKLHSSWWFPFEYNAWDAQNDDVVWLQDKSDLPHFESIIEVTNPDDGSKWLVLNCHFILQQKILADTEPLKSPTRDIFFFLDGYVVKKSDMTKLYEWAKNQNYRDARFPEYSSTNNLFLGELYWRRSVRLEMDQYNSPWTNRGARFVDLPAKVYVPVCQYTYGSEYDCSADTHFSILLPNKLLVEKMKLTNKMDGSFVDPNGKIVVRDPSILEKGPSMLLVRKDSFVNFLQNNDYDVIWQVIGQKSVLDGWRTSPEDWKGDLDIHGVFRLANDTVNGVLNSQYVSHNS